MRSPFRILPSLALAALMGMNPLAAFAASYEITIVKMKFGSLPALKVGDVITWRNDDIFRHTATARDKSFDIDLPPKSERSMTIKKAGKVDFYCRFHPMMKGTLNIQP